MSSLIDRLSTALVSRGLVTKDQISTLLEEAGEAEKSFVKLLISRNITSEAVLLGLLSEELSIPTISLAKYQIDPAVARLIPERVARQYTLIPISKLADRLVVAMADPMNIIALDDLKALTQHVIDPVLAAETELRRAIDQCYGDGQAMPVTIAGDEAQEIQGEANLESIVQLLLAEDAGEAPVVRAINLIILEALRKRASDIHLEPMEQSLRVRYRIDGSLVDAHRLPKAVQSTVLTRLKIMSGLDITEWRLPQDGRFKVRLDAQEVDFRVSVLPIIHGGKIVMRALNKSNLSIGLDNLGFLPDSINAFKEAVKRPFGMILVTGPTGSGKSTTLYSILNQLNAVTRNLITVEDPVEYQLPGVTQVPVNPDIGLTFARGLRSILRQNPDVVMVGEIRDFETADIAMKASLTGHLVLSTLHTNDAPSAVTRLVDMGVEPFLVASSVTLIEAQRLVRKLCPKCREPYEPPAELLERLGINRLKPGGKANGAAAPVFYRARGCHLCQQRGYRGRMGIIEVVLLDERMRELIVGKAHAWEIKNYAIEKLGMSTLREDGLKKAAMGLTTLEEVLQVTAEE